MREPLDRVSALRRQIREADEAVSDRDLRDLWDEAQFELRKVRLFGDLVLAAFFEGSKPKEREQKRTEYVQRSSRERLESYRNWLDEWRDAEQPLDRSIGRSSSPRFSSARTWLRCDRGESAVWGVGRFRPNARDDLSRTGCSTVHEESHGNDDIVAHFFRRHSNRSRRRCLRPHCHEHDWPGRHASHRPALDCQHEGEIFAARTRVKWPGLAAVVVSVVHVMKGAYSGSKSLDDRVVETITAFLFHRGGHDNP